MVTDGGYIVPAAPGTWTITASPASLALIGYKQPASPAQATAASGSVTALDLLFSPLFTQGTSFAVWKTSGVAGFSASDLANLAISGESADPDGDSLTNLMEYALGGSPKVADSATVAPVVDSNGTQLWISFRCDDSRQDLIYTVQSSETLKSNS